MRVSVMTQHARARALERYGVALDETGIQGLAGDCAEGRSVLVARLKHGHELRLVSYQGVVMAAMYLPAEHLIATFYPPDWRLHTKRNGKRKRKT